MEKNLFTWLHLSDLHFGHGPASHRWDQRLVLQSLIEDLTQLLAGDVPRPNVILITGDIAQTGASSEYDEARAWFSKLTAITGVAGPDILVLPGNHDVQRQAGQENRHTFRLLQSLRTKAESIDEALGNPADRELLAGRSPLRVF